MCAFMRVCACVQWGYPTLDRSLKVFKKSDSELPMVINAHSNLT